jgi:hypothetical protein
MGWMVSATPRLLYPGERDPVPIVCKQNRLLHTDEITVWKYLTDNILLMRKKLISPTQQEIPLTHVLQ